MKIGYKIDWQTFPIVFQFNMYKIMVSDESISVDAVILKSIHNWI